MKGSCRLCRNTTELNESHIIPSFVFKWFKETSGTGFIRFGHTPNQRMQDGLKPYWLCDDCERLFNSWETVFANNIFHPMNKGERPTSSYGPWLLKFAVSVSWRVLNYFLEEHELSHFPNELLLSTEKALAKWKDFMLDQSPDPGQFEQHMLPFNCLVGFDHPDMPPNINRYMLRTVDIDAVKLGEKDGFVYSKMGRIVLIGFIEISHPQRWKGTKLHVKKGVLGSKHYSLPAEFGEYFLSKARRLAEINKSMSGKQKQKIEDTYRKNINRAISSETLKAIDYDVKLFGKKAFDKNE
ncbi:MAG: hypothetical protein ACOY8P_10835 [Thermodesulfobacteriota bacterium]